MGVTPGRLDVKLPLVKVLPLSVHELLLYQVTIVHLLSFSHLQRYLLHRLFLHQLFHPNSPSLHLLIQTNVSQSDCFCLNCLAEGLEEVFYLSCAS